MFNPLLWKQSIMRNYKTFSGAILFLSSEDTHLNGNYVIPLNDLTDAANVTNTIKKYVKAANINTSHIESIFIVSKAMRITASDVFNYNTISPNDELNQAYQEYADYMSTKTTQQDLSK